MGYEFHLFTYDDKGNELDTKWEVTPIDFEPSFGVIANDKARATGAGSSRPFAVYEIWNLTFGAGTLLRDLDNFLRFWLIAHRITWRRTVGVLLIDEEFEIMRDGSEQSFDYLRSKRSLKRKSVKIRQKNIQYYNKMEEFLWHYEEVIGQNALW